MFIMNRNERISFLSAIQEVEHLNHSVRRALTFRIDDRVLNVALAAKNLSVILVIDITSFALRYESSS